jgi:hypothetical protein
VRRLLPVLLALSCQPQGDPEAVLDPQACADCHPDHVREWEGSMHAYAAEDPVFRALNRLGQEETDGELGDFCVQCHAPVALAEGWTEDGTNLDQVPQHLQGVTCAFCHQTLGATGTHNAAVETAWDGILRGGIADPIDSAFHPSRYSPHLDSDDQRSSDMCGACHDVVLPNGFHLERTYAEWQASIFSGDDPSRQSCGHCHLRGRDGRAATVAGAPERRVHDHRMAGLDVALTPWPHIDDQLAQIQEELDRTLTAELCVGAVGGGTEIRVALENAGAAHHFVSGATHDRRAWVEVRAFQDGEPIFERGAIDDAEPLRPEPDLWILHDEAFDAEGRKTHRFWDITELTPHTLPTTTTLDPRDPAYDHSVRRSWTLVGQTPDRVTVRVRVRPIGHDLVDVLARDADLDPAVKEQIRTFTLGPTALTWEGALGTCVGGLR